MLNVGRVSIRLALIPTQPGHCRSSNDSPVRMTNHDNIAVPELIEYHRSHSVDVVVHDWQFVVIAALPDIICR